MLRTLLASLTLFCLLFLTIGTHFIFHYGELKYVVMFSVEYYYQKTYTKCFVLFSHKICEYLNLIKAALASCW